MFSLRKSPKVFILYVCYSYYFFGDLPSYLLELAVLLNGKYPDSNKNGGRLGSFT